MLDRNCLQWKHLRMVNMLTDRIKMLNDINKMEQSAETNKLDKWNLTGCLKIISRLCTGQEGGCLTGCISRLTHSAHCSAHSPDLPSQSYSFWRLQLPPAAADVTFAALVQAKHLKSTCSTLSSLAQPPSHPTNIIHLLKSITIHQVTQSSLTQLVPLSHRKSLAAYTFRLLHYYFSGSSFFTELSDQGFIHLNDFLPMCLNPSFLLSFYPFPSQHLYKRRIWSCYFPFPPCSKKSVSDFLLEVSSFRNHWRQEYYRCLPLQPHSSPFLLIRVLITSCLCPFASFFPSWNTNPHPPGKFIIFYFNLSSMNPSVISLTLNNLIFPSFSRTLHISVLMSNSLCA